MKFTVIKKGYNPTEVDNYVSQAEQALSAQKERILKLKKKTDALETELESYYEKKDLILTALSEAVKKAEEIEHKANQKYDLEIQRLRQFHAKWTEYYDKLLKKYPTDIKNTDNFNRDMDRILRETEWNTDDSEEISESADSLYKKEQARLNKTAKGNIGKTDSSAEVSKAKKEKNQELTPLDRIKNYLDKGYEVNKKNAGIPSELGVFSLEEALHPKQDLAGIMKDLGLIED